MYWIFLALGVLLGNWIAAPLILGPFDIYVFDPYPSMATFLHGVLAAVLVLLFGGFTKLVKRIKDS